MENLKNSENDFTNVPGDIEYIPQRSRGDNRLSGEKTMNAANAAVGNSEVEKKHEQRIKAKNVLLGVAVAALIVGGLMLAKDGEEYKPKSQDEWRAMIERSSYANADIDYGQDSSTVEFNYGGAHYFLEDIGNDGSFEKGSSVKEGGAASADFAFTEIGLTIDGAVGELNARMK